MTFAATFICDLLDTCNHAERHASYKPDKNLAGIALVSTTILAVHVAKFLFQDQPPSSLILRSLTQLETGVHGLRIVAEGVSCSIDLPIHIDTYYFDPDRDPWHVPSKLIATAALAANFVARLTLTNPVVKASWNGATTFIRCFSHIGQDGYLRSSLF